MGMTYVQMMRDSEMLQVQMHGYAAATGDADIAAACRRTFEVLWHLAHYKVKLDQEMIQNFFAHGMLLSVMSAIDILAVDEIWAQSICPGQEKFDALATASKAHSSAACAPPCTLARAPW